MRFRHRGPHACSPALGFMYFEPSLSEADTSHSGSALLVKPLVSLATGWWEGMHVVGCKAGQRRKSAMTGANPDRYGLSIKTTS
jgi:hypothetical protein